MRISLETLEGYSYRLDGLADEAERQVSDRLTEYWRSLRGLDPEKAVPLMREEATAALVNAENTFGISSASLGHEMLSSAVGREVPYGIEGLEVADDYADSQSARYWAKFLDGTDEGFQSFLRGITARARRNVSHAADREIARSSEKMGRKVKGIRFARVPSGPACGFCIMLASRGFVYATRESAGEFTKFHDDCGCRIVAGMQGIEVEGYDPKGLYDRYAMCVRAVNGGELGSSSGAIWDDWERLSDDERESWGKESKHGKDAFNNYFAHRVCREMDTRDREWLWSGIPSKNPSIADGATPDEWESKVADILWDNGLVADFQPRSLGLNDRRADTLVNGSKWEIKNPTGNNPLTAFNQFKSVVFGQNKHVRNPQADSVVISNVRSTISAQELVRQAYEVLTAGEFPEIRHVLIADARRDGVYRLDA